MVDDVVSWGTQAIKYLVIKLNTDPKKIKLNLFLLHLEYLVLHKLSASALIHVLLSYKAYFSLNFLT